MLIRMLFMLMLLLAACSQQGNYPQRTPPQGLLDSAEAIAAGRRIFTANCARCHGHPDEGRSPRANFFSPPAPDFFAAHYRQVDPAYLYWRVETGKTVEPYLDQGSVMPAWGPYLTARQIWQLVAYLRQRAKSGDP